ncbi:hypothetical protein [Nocardia abscessus]|uniref:hypothetical protein n=1 Tax=Nocardia abscessus TaxID=120957 RepID=UPI002453A812|nr:hypothetical protein [Nocardia abscessus]
MELELACYLDEEDRRLIAARRRDYNRLGFAVQVVTVFGCYLAGYESSHQTSCVVQRELCPDTRKQTLSWKLTIKLPSSSTVTS